MGYMFVLGQCYSCGRPFTFNPHLVPSIPIMPDGTVGAGGRREPICRTCAEIANTHRAANGLPLWDIRDEAYEPTESI